MAASQNTSEDNAPKLSLPQRWINKFTCATRGMVTAFSEEDSFTVHLPVGFAVLVLGMMQGIDRLDWLLLVICVTIVIAAELFNSAIERLATAITAEVDPNLRDALDIASGAVLVTSIGAAVVGVLVLFW